MTADKSGEMGCSMMVNCDQVDSVPTKHDCLLGAIWRPVSCMLFAQSPVGQPEFRTQWFLAML
jgi:hypothetical protein